jgi:hypothetical protein
MSSLHELIHGLSPRETTIVKNYLQFFSGNKQSENILSVQLFDYIHNAKEKPSDEDCCKAIYGTGKDNHESFKKLKYRLKSKILDSLLTDLGEDKKEMMDEVDYAAFRVKKKSIQSRLLYFSNPHSETSRELLEEIIAECKKYEFYNILEEHLDIQKTRYTFKNGEKEFDKASAEVLHYRQCADAVSKANDYYYKLIFISEKNEKDGVKIRTFLTDVISELTQSAIKTKSNMIRYFLKFFEIYYYMRSKSYLKARDICAELIDMINRSPALKRKQRLGTAYSNFSVCEIYLENFNKALEYAQKARKNFIPCSFDHSVAWEQEFYALFYSGQFDKAEIVAQAMLSTASRKELGEMLYAKYNFLHANALFKKGEFSDAARILNQKWEITNDKEHWETELRILSIMTAIELDNFDTAVSQTESLRKFMQRNEKEHPESPRNKTILKLLLLIEKKGFRFNDKSEALLEQLSAPNQEQSWELLSAELIPFHLWIKEKMQRSLVA